MSEEEREVLVAAMGEAMLASNLWYGLVKNLHARKLLQDSDLRVIYDNVLSAFEQMNAKPLPGVMADAFRLARQRAESQMKLAIGGPARPSTD